MRNILWRALAVLFLTGPLVSQADRSQPFDFKDDKLGMGLEEFTAKHLEPGRWEDEATRTIAVSHDSNIRPPGKGNWRWKPDLECKEVIAGVIARCQYATTVAGITWAHVTVVFVDHKLAAINVSSSAQSAVVKQALIDKLGQPIRMAVSGHSNRDLSALRWDNGVSVVEFQEHYCGSGSYNSQQGWSRDVTEVLTGIYCANDDTGDYGSAFIWYVHRVLANLAINRWEEAIQTIKDKARSEPFSFDATLQMPLRDFKATHGNPSCNQTARGIHECEYGATVSGIRTFARAIFADEKLAAIHFYFLQIESHSATVSGILVPVDVKQSLIAKFGQPGVIRGHGDSVFTGDDRRALEWDEGGSIIEYQPNGCTSGNEYDRIEKVLQRRYCEKNESGDGTVSIWHIDKALSSAVLSRHKEAEENARKKARADM